MFPKVEETVLDRIESNWQSEARFLSELVAERSVLGQEAGAQERIAQELRDFGLKPELWQLDLRSALGNQFISLIKDSTLVSVITVNELLLTGRNVISRTFEPMTVYMAIAFVYLVLSNFTAVMIGRIERYYYRPCAGSR